MTIRKVLRDLATAVADEAAQNPEFARTLGEILKSPPPQPRRRTSARRPANRRAPALLDPVAIARDGEDALRSRLASLDLERLRDIVAEHGMDQGRLVMRWKTPARVIDKIVEISIGRARKGDAFR